MQRRLISSEAVSAWTSKISRIIHPARNAELYDYQAQLRDTRKKLIQDRSGQPSKSEAVAERKRTTQKELESKWEASIAETREKVKAIVSETLGQNVAQKHHPCRPTIRHMKTAEQQAQNQASLAAALRPILVARRKYVKFLADLQPSMVTRENLESKIERAISNPSDYNISIERAINEEMAVRAKLSEMRVPDDLGKM